jgi:hypothetical protein
VIREWEDGNGRYIISSREAHIRNKTTGDDRATGGIHFALVIFSCSLPFDHPLMLLHECSAYINICNNIEAEKETTKTAKGKSLSVRSETPCD